MLHCQWWRLSEPHVYLVPMEKLRYFSPSLPQPSLSLVLRLRGDVNSAGVAPAPGPAFSEFFNVCVPFLADRLRFCRSDYVDSNFTSGPCESKTHGVSARPPCSRPPFIFGVLMWCNSSDQ